MSIATPISPEVGIQYLQGFHGDWYSPGAAACGPCSTCEPLSTGVANRLARRAPYLHRYGDSVPCSWPTSVRSTQAYTSGRLWPANWIPWLLCKNSRIWDGVRLSDFSIRMCIHPLHPYRIASFLRLILHWKLKPLQAHLALDNSVRRGRTWFTIE